MSFLRLEGVCITKIEVLVLVVKKVLIIYFNTFWHRLLITLNMHEWNCCKNVACFWYPWDVLVWQQWATVHDQLVLRPWLRSYWPCYPNAWPCHMTLTFDSNPRPWAMTLAFSHLKAMVLTYANAIDQSHRSVDSTDRVETDGWR